MKTILALTKKSKKVNSTNIIEQSFWKIDTKPKKADGTRWIDFKFWAMEKVLENYGPYMTYLEPITHNDSQLKKREEIKGFVSKWKDTGYSMHIAIFIITDAPIKPIISTWQAWSCKGIWMNLLGPCQSCV